jgi:hypothetical protein
VRAVNLIPVDRRVGAGPGLGRSQGGAYALLVLVAVLALLVFVYGKAAHDVTSDNSQTAKLTTEAEQVKSDAGALARYNGLISQSEARTTAAETLIASRFDWAHALHEVGRVLPSGVSIASLAGTMTAGSASPAPAGSGSGSSSSTVSSATPPGSLPTIILTGCGTGQTKVAEMLSRLRLIDGVKEATLSSSTASGTSGGGGGSCPSPNATFSVTVNFEPLPASTSVSSAATNVSNPASSAGSTESSK